MRRNVNVQQQCGSRPQTCSGETRTGFVLSLPEDDGMILVIGGAGYIGSHMVKCLLQHGEDVLIMDTLEKGHREAIVGGKFVEGDLRRPDDLKQVFGKHDVESVMHFAA